MQYNTQKEVLSTAGPGSVLSGSGAGAVDPVPAGAAGGKNHGPDSLPKQMISIIQINLNKTHAAHTELLRKINKLENYIVLVTEPYCYRKKLCIIPKGSNYLPQNRGGHPQASIFSSKNLKIHEINELKTRDVAIGMIKLDGKSTVIVCIWTLPSR